MLNVERVPRPREIPGVQGSLKLSITVELKTEESFTNGLKGVIP